MTYASFCVIDRRTAWEIFSLHPPDGTTILDREETFEDREGVRVDYRNIVFSSGTEGAFLLTGASYVLDPMRNEKHFAFFLYSEERWSADEEEPVSCPEMMRRS